MYKVCIEMDDAIEIKNAMSCLAKMSEVNSPIRKKAFEMASRLDDLIVVVQEENRIVEDYIMSIKRDKALKA